MLNDALIYEFESKQAADDYNSWFTEKVERALSSDKPVVAHDEAVSRIREKLAKKLAGQS